MSTSSLFTPAQAAQGAALLWRAPAPAPVAPPKIYTKSLKSLAMLTNAKRTLGGRVVDQTYLNMMARSTRFRMPCPLQQKNPGEPIQCTIPAGTILFRAVGGQIKLSDGPFANLNKTKFHYFHPFGALGVGSLTATFENYYLMVVQFDINVMLLLKPKIATPTPSFTKKLIRNLNAIKFPGQLGGRNNRLNKNKCRPRNIQGWIGLSGEDAGYHRQLNRNYFKESTRIKQNFFQSDGYSYGFPECVLWYKDLSLPNANRGVNNELIVEPLAVIHMPRSAYPHMSPEETLERLTYMSSFYELLRNESGIIEKTTLMTNYGPIPFNTFALSESAIVKNLQQHL